MSIQSFHPLYSLANTIILLLRGRVHFPRERLGQTLVLEGEKWIIFRQVIIDVGPDRPAQPGAVFRPRFHLRGMSARVNMLFSWIPVPFFYRPARVALQAVAVPPGQRRFLGLVRVGQRGGRRVLQPFVRRGVYDPPLAAWVGFVSCASGRPTRILTMCKNPTRKLPVSTIC